MSRSNLGKEIPDGTIIFHQGETGHSMYIILQGSVEIYLEEDIQEISLARRGQGDFLGEMALLTQEKRSASARAIGPVRLLSLDKKNFLRRVQEDPTIAMRLVAMLSSRIRELDTQVVVLTQALRDCIGSQTSK